MNRFREILVKNELSLIVSIPRTSVEMAKRAAFAGADAIKLHTSIVHPASGYEFPPLERQADLFREIRAATSIALGVVPGRNLKVDQAEVSSMEDLGIDFVDLQLSSFPPLLLRSRKLARMVAVPLGTPPDVLDAVRESGIDAIELELLQPAEFGRPLSPVDVVSVRAFTRTTALPVVMPSQQALVPSDVEFLLKTGIKALMIGAVVTGEAPDTVEKVTEEFRAAIDKVLGR